MRLVTHLKHRFGQRVVICGVPGSIGNDLVAAAGESDHMEVAKLEAVDKEVVKQALIKMIHTGPAPLRYWSVNIIDQWAAEERQGIPGTSKEKRDVLHDLLRDGVLAKREIDLTTVGKKGGVATETYLVEDKAHEMSYLPIKRDPSSEGSGETK